MILDGLLTFTGTSNGQTGGITSGPQTDLPTTGTTIASNIIDLGLSGLPASISGGGGGGARDISVGDDRMLLLSAICIIAFTSGSTIQLELSGAIDNGSGAPSSTYTVMWTSPAYASPVVAGAQLANVNVPRVIEGQALPRFLRLRFIQGSTANTTGTIEAQIVLDRFDQIVGTGGALSGYPAGINIAN